MPRDCLHCHHPAGPSPSFLTVCTFLLSVALPFLLFPVSLFSFKYYRMRRKMNGVARDVHVVCDHVWSCARRAMHDLKCLVPGAWPVIFYYLIFSYFIDFFNINKILKKHLNLSLCRHCTIGMLDMSRAENLLESGTKRRLKLCHRTIEDN